MSDINKSLQDAYSRNASLLATLGETDYAVPAMKQTEQYIEELQKELANTEKKYWALGAATQKEKRDHEEYQKSMFKKFAYRATGQRGKYESKASQEEREYVHALEEESRMKGVKESLAARLEDAKQAKENLQYDWHRHNDAQEQLDALYNTIFSGPTPSVLGEDQKEEEVQKTLDTYRDIQGRRDAEKRVISLLNTARHHCNIAIQHAGSAHSYSTWDCWGGGMMSDMMERDELANAQRAVSQLESAYKDATWTSPHVKPLNQLKLAEGHMWSDVFFDTLGGDLRMHDEIKNEEGQLQTTGQNIDLEVIAAKRRVADLESELDNATTNLEAVRKELQDLRATAFNNIAAQ